MKLKLTSALEWFARAWGANSSGRPLCVTAKFSCIYILAEFAYALGRLEQHRTRSIVGDRLDLIQTNIDGLQMTVSGLLVLAISRLCSSSRFGSLRIG